MEARKTGFVTYGRYSNFVEYEYKGYTYEVEFAKDHSYCCLSARIQHQDKQAEIDRIIEAKNNPKPYKYEDTAEYGFNLFWEYVERGTEQC